MARPKRERTERVWAEKPYQLNINHGLYPFQQFQQPNDMHQQKMYPHMHVCMDIVIRTVCHALLLCPVSERAIQGDLSQNGWHYAERIPPRGASSNASIVTYYYKWNHHKTLHYQYRDGESKKRQSMHKNLTVYVNFCQSRVIQQETQDDQGQTIIKDRPSVEYLHADQLASLIHCSDEYGIALVRMHMLFAALCNSVWFQAIRDYQAWRPSSSFSVWHRESRFPSVRVFWWCLHKLCDEQSDTWVAEILAHLSSIYVEIPGETTVLKPVWKIVRHQDSEDRRQWYVEIAPGSWIDDVIASGRWWRWEHIPWIGCMRLRGQTGWMLSRVLWYLHLLGVKEEGVMLQNKLSMFSNLQVEEEGRVEDIPVGTLLRRWNMVLSKVNSVDDRYMYLPSTSPKALGFIVLTSSLRSLRHVRVSVENSGTTAQKRGGASMSSRNRRQTAAQRRLVEYEQEGHQQQARRQDRVDAGVAAVEATWLAEWSAAEFRDTVGLEALYNMWEVWEVRYADGELRWPTSGNKGIIGPMSRFMIWYRCYQGGTRETLAEVSARLGVHINTYHRIEQGQSGAGVVVFRKLPLPQVGMRIEDTWYTVYQGVVRVGFSVSFSETTMGSGVDGAEVDEVVCPGIRIVSSGSGPRQQDRRQDRREDRGMGVCAEVESGSEDPVECRVAKIVG